MRNRARTLLRTDLEANVPSETSGREATVVIRLGDTDDDDGRGGI